MSFNWAAYSKWSLLVDQNRGDFTFCSHQGQSTIDYILLNIPHFETLSNFEILNLNKHSDHAPITFNIYLYRKTTPESKNQECHEGEISRKLFWDSAKIEDFHSELSSSNVHIQQMTSNADIEPIIDVVRPRLFSFFTIKNLTCSE